MVSLKETFALYTLSQRAQNVQASATLALTARARALRAQGRNVISFAAGEPDYNSPEPALTAAHQAIDAGYTKYAPVAGYPELRGLILDDIVNMGGMRRQDDEVIVSLGAKHVLYNLIQALIDPGDKVAFCSPYWVSYPSMVSLAGGQSVVLPTTADEDFVLPAERLAKALDEHKPKAFILNSPQNPTGAVYPPEVVDALVELCVERGVLVISDEIYGRLVYGDTAHRTAFAIDTPARREHVVVVAGVSKTYSMTGWRIGYAVGPRDLIQAAVRIQSHSTSGASSISQYAAIGAYKAGLDCVQDMFTAFRERRETMAARLAELPEVKFSVPQGAFYAFPDVSHYCRGQLAGQTISNDFDLAGALLDHYDIAVVPGTAFGAPGHLRLSFALGLDDISDGLARMKKAFEQWTE